MPRAVSPLLVLLGATIVAALVGGVVGALALAGAGDSNGWEALGAFLFGLLAACVAFVVAYVVGLVFAARRAFAPGSRSFPVFLALGIPVVISVLASSVGGVAGMLGADLTPLAGLPAIVAVLAAGPLAFAWGDTNAGRRRLAIAVAAMAVLVVAIAGVGIGVDRVRANRVVAQLPLVLFEGQTAEAPFQGWRRDECSSLWVSENRRGFTSQGQSAYLKYLTPGGVVFVTMHSEVGPCEDTVTYTCRPESTASGAERRSYTHLTTYGSFPRSRQFSMHVFPDGGAVSVNGTAQTLTTPDEVLEQLVRVDRETFERETGAPIQVR